MHIKLFTKASALIVSWSFCFIIHADKDPTTSCKSFFQEDRGMVYMLYTGEENVKVRRGKRKEKVLGLKDLFGSPTFPAIPKTFPKHDPGSVNQIFLQPTFLPFLKNLYNLDDALSRFPLEFVFDQHKIFSLDAKPDEELYEVRFDLHYEGIPIHDTYIKLRFRNNHLVHFQFQVGFPTNWNPKDKRILSPRRSIQKAKREFFRQHDVKIFDSLLLADGEAEPSPFRTYFYFSEKRRKWFLVHSFLVIGVDGDQRSTPFYLNVNALTGRILYWYDPNK